MLSCTDPDESFHRGAFRTEGAEQAQRDKMTKKVNILQMAMADAVYSGE